MGKVRQEDRMSELHGNSYKGGQVDGPTGRQEYMIIVRQVDRWKGRQYDLNTWEKVDKKDLNTREQVDR